MDLVLYTIDSTEKQNASIVIAIGNSTVGGARKELEEGEGRDNDLYIIN